MNKDEAIAKINRMGHIGQVVTIICKVLVGLGLAASLLGVIAFALIPQGFVTISGRGGGSIAVDVSKIGQTLSDADRARIEQSILEQQPLSTSFTLGGTTIDLSNSESISVEGNVIQIGGSGSAGFDLRNFIYPCIGALIVCIITFVSLWFAGKLCKAIRYCESPFTQEIVTKLRQLAFSLIPWVFASSMTSGMVADLMTGVVPGLSLGIDLGMVMVVLVVLALSYIFRYGAQLQQESDETL